MEFNTYVNEETYNELFTKTLNQVGMDKDKVKEIRNRIVEILEDKCEEVISNIEGIEALLKDYYWEPKGSYFFVSYDNVYNFTF